MSLATFRESFLGNFIFDYKVAAFSRSSSSVIRRVLAECGTAAKVIVEQGAGDGVLTKALLLHMPTDGKLIVIEQNKDFLISLRLLSDPRLFVVEGSVEGFEYDTYLSHGEHVDVVVSSVPFSFLHTQERLQVCKEAYDRLSSGGKIIIFHQYSLLMKDVIATYFTHVSSFFILRNIFPCFVIVGTKK